MPNYHHRDHGRMILQPAVLEIQSEYCTAVWRLPLGVAVANQRMLMFLL